MKIVNRLNCLVMSLISFCNFIFSRASTTFNASRPCKAHEPSALTQRRKSYISFAVASKSHACISLASMLSTISLAVFLIFYLTPNDGDQREPDLSAIRCMPLFARLWRSISLLCVSSLPCCWFHSLPCDSSCSATALPRDVS